MSRAKWLILLGLMVVTTDLPARRPPGDDGRSRLSRLQGTVMAGRRSPVVGAAVMARREGDESTLYLTTTGDQGLFRLDGLPDGTYRLDFTREGKKRLVKDDVTLRFPFRAVVEVMMEPGERAGGPVEEATTVAVEERVRVVGRVVELGGTPLGEIRLRLVREGGGEDPRTLRTRPDGGFEVDGMMPGLWRAEVEGVGLLSLRASLDLARDTKLEICLIRQPADYRPSPLDLMPPEQPIPPPGWTGEEAGGNDSPQPPSIESRTAK